MKRTFMLCAAAFAASAMLTSCYTYSAIVSKGARGKEKITEWNHYALFGLKPVAISDAAVMADGTEDYMVTTKLSFINGFISGLTLGLYNPATTTVT